MRSLVSLISIVRSGALGPNPADQQVSVGFSTHQGVRHAARDQSYRNTVVSLRVEQAVGSCAVEPGSLSDDDVYDCVGATVADLLDHPSLPIRIAALDAYLMNAHPHETSGARQVTIPAGTSLTKSLARAAAVVDLLDAAPGSRILVVGVVNSLLHHLRERGLTYIACDLKGGRTEWDEPIATDIDAVPDCDAVLASGMTIGNDTLEPLLHKASQPVVLFAQTASAVLPWFIGTGVAAVSAEPFPFWWLDGAPSTIHLYRGEPT